MLGWTQEVPDFAVPVQAAQPVQPEFKKDRKNIFSAASRRGPRRLKRSLLDLPKRADTLTTLDQVNKCGHFSRPALDVEVGRG
jgi:hypothetical protein